MLLEIGVAIINTLVRRLSGGSNFSIKVDFWPPCWSQRPAIRSPAIILAIMAQFLCCSGLLRRLRRGGAWIWSTISANCGHHRSTTGPPQCHKRIMVSGGSTECAKNERRLSWAGPPKAGPAKAGAPQLSLPLVQLVTSRAAQGGSVEQNTFLSAPPLGNTNTLTILATHNTVLAARPSPTHTFKILPKLIFVENL